MATDISSYSAEVDMFLEFDGDKLPLGQLGPSHCIVERTRSLPPGEAEIVLQIDGRESRLPVFLPDGISPNQPRVAYQSRNGHNGNGNDARN